MTAVKVIWKVEIENTRKKQVVEDAIITYYRPEKEKIDAALEDIPLHLKKDEKLIMVISKLAEVSR